jgi:hypothetical protein
MERRLACLVALVIVCALALWLDKPSGVKLVTVLMGLSLFSLPLDTAWVYQGLARCGRPGAAMTAGQVPYVSRLFLAVKNPA